MRGKMRGGQIFFTRRGARRWGGSAAKPGGASGGAGAIGPGTSFLNLRTCALDRRATITIANHDADGYVIADAVQLLPINEDQDG